MEILTDQYASILIVAIAVFVIACVVLVASKFVSLLAKVAALLALVVIAYVGYMMLMEGVPL